MQTTMARTCVAYGTFWPTTTGPVFSSLDRVKEASRRPTDDMTA